MLPDGAEPEGRRTQGRRPIPRRPVRRNARRTQARRAQGRKTRTAPVGSCAVRGLRRCAFRASRGSGLRGSGRAPCGLCVVRPAPFGRCALPSVAFLPEPRRLREWI